MGGKLIYSIRSLGKGILEVLYPIDDKCIICKVENVQGLCHNCRDNITFCSEDELCIGYYKGTLKELILKLKYKKDFNAGDILVDLINEKLKNISKEFILTYIPIGKRALKERGFNQCEYLAKELGFRNNLRVIDTLYKVRDTKVQKTLTREERKKNLIGAFKAKNTKYIKNNKFILIDDVITTGSTLNIAKNILKENGALEIKILTLAKSHI